MGRPSSEWPLGDPAAADFGAAYLECFDEVYARTLPMLEAHPGMAALYAARTPAQRAASKQTARERLEQVLGGDWDFYADTLEFEGGSYADMGVTIEEWHEISTAQEDVLTDALIARYAGDPPRLARALKVMHAFVGRSRAIVGNAYRLASQRTLRQWESVFQNIAWGICLVDPVTFRILHANRALLEMYGLDASDLGSRTFPSLFGSGEHERLLREQRPYESIEGRFSHEGQHLRLDGTTFPVLIDGVRIPANVADRTYWAISARDLSERRQVESLRMRAGELEAENRRVQESNRLKSEFLANMSHELRTPLNSILGFSELLVAGEVGPLDEQQRDFIGDIHTSGKHLLRLINDVLDLSKVEAGKMEFYPEEIELEALVAEVTGVLRSVASEKSITSRVDIDPSIGTLHLDPARLKQVLYNYLSNAFKFSAAGASVYVRARRSSPGTFCVEVRDQGNGIAEADLKRLFVDFEQLDLGRGKLHGGTGLGLALTRRLVEAQGGTVGVESKLGEGSTFFAVLPMRVGAAADTDAARRPVT